MKQIVSHLSQKMIAALVMGIAATASAGPRDYMVIDLSGGPNAKTYPVSYSAEPPDLDFDTCRTKELWLRLIPAGTFMIGSPTDELGHHAHEKQHQVTLTQPFYMGVFQMTQKQYELVMGTNPSEFKGDTRPVEKVSFERLRGRKDGAQWPANNAVDADSFFGKIRAKTSLVVDLPTEAQWEYACRAGTLTSINSAKGLTDKAQCSNMAEVARYAHNQKDGKGKYAEHTKVGMYKPNAWQLYDMHGNVWELCLNWKQDDLGRDPVTDPQGPQTGWNRTIRGGSYAEDARNLRSACRWSCRSANDQKPDTGFRIVVNLDTTQAAALAPPPPIAPLSTGNLSTTDDEKLAATCAEFKSVWESYKENIEKINAEFQPKCETLNQQYLKSLEVLRTTVRNRGDLDKTKAVTAEMERFEKEKSIPPSPDEKTITEIKTLQTNAARPFMTLERDMLTRLSTLTQRYGQALEQVQANLVKADKLDDATAVSEARKRAKQTADDLATQLAARTSSPPARPATRR